MTLWKLRGRSVATIASVVALTATGTMAINSALAPDPINGCVSKLTAGLRILTAGQSCNGLETPISWNGSGPAGPVGPSGAQGPQGVQGVPGPAGPAGSTNSFLDNHPAAIDVFSASGPARILEISGWDVPAGSYRLEATATLIGSTSSTNPQQPQVTCQVRSGTTVLKERIMAVLYPHNNTAFSLQTQVKLDAPTRVQLACYGTSVTIGDTTTISQVTFQVTGLGTTRGL
jgi:hypothetical protein